MRTNIVLDDSLVAKAFGYSDATTKKDLIHEALEVFVEMKSKKDLRSLKGKVHFADNYDYKTLRRDGQS